MSDFNEGRHPLSPRSNPKIVPPYIFPPRKESLEIENARLKAEVERLTNAGDDMADTLEREGFYGAINCWNAAKEGKQP